MMIEKENKEKVNLKADLIAKWRNLDVVELQNELQELIKQQFKLKMQHSIGELKSTQKLKFIRKNIARAFTLLKEKNAN